MTDQPKPIKSIDELQKIVKNCQYCETFISLNGGLRSSKTIFWDDITNGFRVFNHIDSSQEFFTPADLDDPTRTNIGLAIKQNAFFLTDVVEN